MVALTNPKAYEALPTFPHGVLWVVFPLVLVVYWLDPSGTKRVVLAPFPCKHLTCYKHAVF